MAVELEDSKGPTETLGEQIPPQNQGCQPSVRGASPSVLPVLNWPVSQNTGIRSLGDTHSPSPSLRATEPEPIA